MNGSFRDPLAFVSLCLLLFSAPARADDDISFEELPAVVQDVARKEIGKGIITEIEVDDDTSGLTYEIEFELDGIEYEIDIAETGRIIRKTED